MNVHPWKPDGVIRSPGVEVTGSCEPLCRCWELDLGSLQEQQVLLMAELSFYPLWQDFTYRQAFILVSVFPNFYNLRLWKIHKASLNTLPLKLKRKGWSFKLTSVGLIKIELKYFRCTVKKFIHDRFQNLEKKTKNAQKHLTKLSHNIKTTELSC